ncbi:DUF2459 domain-containing protein [Thermaurantiacus tibetensis]|uniref:DUF2459 domain-containing protein n=1 Tax=Thermaurantiacus tibetensis TaxID=2759035 RepID=UPI00188EDFB5|nr:DUF2459 domain-containing protein [Thermaurantiacus tibetensis]
MARPPALARLALVPLALPPLYLLAALLGALVPQNRPLADPGPRPVTIHLDSSVVHTELVLPVAAAGHDWRRRFPTFADGRTAEHFVSVSWGERDFFLATPTWADVDLRLALRALVAGHATLLHVYRLEAPSGRPIRLSEEAYLRLAAHIEAAIAPGPPLPGYGKDDLFLPAHGRYSPWRTCNQWTRDALAAAGVRVGRWTPLPQGLLWRFPNANGKERE